MIENFLGFLCNFNDFLSILASQIPLKIAKKSILGASGDNLASIGCCKVESGWILSILGLIFRGFGLDYASIFEWIERGFCKQSIGERYALIAALNMALLLSHCIFSLTSGAAGCASRLRRPPEGCRAC